MKIKELIINNFRSFKGTTKFSFQTDEDKNIILIGGENGAGKTSIFEAIKLCIYGPLTYKYQGIVPNYVSKIKSMINEDVFIESNIESYIQLKLSINVNRMDEVFDIKRTWKIEKGKLIEEFNIYKDNKNLNSTEQEKFELYLRNTIPPSVFDLFFFDGEKLSEFFNDTNFDMKLRDTIFTINNFDVFSNLRKELHLNIRRKDKEIDALKDYIEEAESLEISISNLEKEIIKNEQDLINLDNTITDLKMDIENTNNEFRRAGGLNSNEKDELQNNINYLDNKRGILNQKIKDYCNDRLPFVIVKDLLKEIKNQLYLEEDFIIYSALNERISSSTIGEIISDSVDIDLIPISNINDMTYKIKKAILPTEFDEFFKPIHYLSKEQQSKVISSIESIMLEKPEKINYFSQINECTKEIAKIREKLSSSLIEEEYDNFIKKISSLNEELNYTLIKHSQLLNNKEISESQLALKLNELRKVNEKIHNVKLTDNIREISTTLQTALYDLTKNITTKKKVEIENNFNYIFSEIIRKEKFIDFIMLDDDFTACLYVRKKYTNIDIIRLIANLNMDEIEKKFGALFIQDLYSKYKTDDRREILTSLNREGDKKESILNTKVDVMNLSSGEKQVYILCLYWAIIKSSNIEIPFIIDTPYGRIDEKHRKSITTKFFPKVSRQVIILSTNTEIEAGLYEDISRYVSKEYMLDYNTLERRTLVNERYFYEVI